MRWQMLSVNPRPPHQGREKGGKGRETYKFDIKTALLIILIIKEMKHSIPNGY